MQLPEELVVEILVRLPGKQLGRCRCVCKSWQLLIESIHFAEAYRKQNQFLMLYWSEEGDPEEDHYGNRLGHDRRLRFFNCPLRRRLNDGSPGDFTPLLELPVKGSHDPVSQVVNGLICVGSLGLVMWPKLFVSDLPLAIYSVFTGEAMEIPYPLLYFSTHSTFHLGYDPVSKRYKILRMIFRRFHPVRANIITLGPSSEDFRWRVVDYESAGISDLSARMNLTHFTTKSHEARTFSGDGVLCWFTRGESLILFDLNKEIFRWVQIPEGVNEDGSQIVPRARFPESGQLSLFLWVLPREGDRFQPEYFVLEDDEGLEWSKHYVELPEEFGEKTRFVAANGSSGAGEILLMDGISDCRDIYSYGGGEKMEKFRAGMIPHNKALDLNAMRPAWDVYSTFDARASLLLDSCDVYLSLDDVLSGLFRV